MTGSIFWNTLRSSWRQAIYWGIGVGILGFYVTFIASDLGVVQQYAELLETLPPAMLNAFGITDARLFTTAEGFISAAYVTYAMIILSVYAVMTGLSITADEEENGILDTLLAMPISRAQVIIEKFTAYALITFALIIVCILMPLIAVSLFSVELDVTKIIFGVLSIYPGILLLIAVTSLFSVLARRRVTAIGFTVVFILVSYFINFLGNAATDSFAVVLQQISLFNYTDGQAIITDTYNPLTSLAILLVTIGCVAMSIRQFNHRDIGL